MQVENMAPNNSVYNFQIWFNELSSLVLSIILQVGSLSTQLKAEPKSYHFSAYSSVLPIS